MRYSYISFYNIDEIQRYKVKLSVIGKNLIQRIMVVGKQKLRVYK